MSITLSALQKQRTDTAANWTAENPTLLAGELGFESDTGKAKLGTGSTAWNSLGYLGLIPSSGIYPLSQLLLPSGTQAAPSLSFDGDTDTGLYRTGANAVAISTNGDGRLFVDGSGNVGVGAATVNAPFHVKTGTGGGATPNAFTKALLESADRAYLEFSSSSTGLGALLFSDNASSRGSIFYDHNDDHMRFGTAGTERLRITSTGTLMHIGAGDSTTPAVQFNGSAPANSLVIDSAGKVGIGATSPGMKLTVNDTTTAQIQFGYNDSIYGRVGRDSNGNYEFSSYENGGNLLFGTTTSTGSTNERARLDSSGRLLVGTTSTSAVCTAILQNRSDNGGPGTLYLSTTTTSPTSVEAFGRIIWTDSGHSPAVQIEGGRDGGTWTSGSSQPSKLTFSTTADGDPSPSPRMTIDSDGNVGIGVTTPLVPLQVNGTIASVTASGTAAKIDFDQNAAGAYSIQIPASQNALAFRDLVANSERARIDSSGRLLVGTTSSIAGATLQVAGTGDLFEVSRFTANSAGPYINTYKSRNATIGGNTAVITDDLLGAIQFHGAEGSSYKPAANIRAFVDSGTISGSSMPGRLVFSTTPDGASSPQERMRVTSSNFVNIGTEGTDIIWNQTSVKGVTLGAAGVIQAARDADQLMLLNRITNDGVLITFAQDGVTEGDISVSGTTVQLNGAHLSRWSQLLDGGREEILRGTVLTNLDEMCDWGEEDNEQLNRMKVSDVEGDPNVAGVFVAWDDDDDTYTDDFYCAMTGDFVIRIAQGVTIARGDLLMSAGDGTAKPQDDDIIRSKTIAKVTSTHVSETYADGSYCVPCVLMAC